MKGNGAAPAIAVAGLRKVFRPGRKGEVTAVDDASFTLAPGELVGVLGPNGAGKTTIVKCLCTLVRPTSGSVHVLGVDAVAEPRLAVRHVAAVLEGNRNVYWRLRVRENIEFFSALHGHSTRDARPYADELIERFGLADKASVPARMLSRGMQQKLAVACALARRTPVLLLDEPTLGLDVETSIELRAYLKELARERTILITSHDMDVVQDLCDRVIIVNRGRVVADDRVANLLALFRAQAYRFVVAGMLTDTQRFALTRRFPVVHVEPDHQSTVIDVEMEDGYALYDLVDVLRAESTLVQSVESREPDLEDVFLRIVREAG